MSITVPTTKGSQSGFTMIEILVAFVISMIGLQGLISIQSYTLGNAQGSYYRAQGITLLNDIAGRMSANPEGVSQGVYDNFTTDNAAAAPDCTTTQTGCSAEDIAIRDLNAWANNFNNVNESQEYSSVLPNGQGAIVRQGDGSYQISVSWDEMAWNTELESGATREVVQVSLTREINILIPF